MMKPVNGARNMSRVHNNIAPVVRDCRTVFGATIKLTVVSAGLVLAGCASYQKDHFTVGSIPKDYRTVHPIVVSQSEQKEDLVVTRSMRSMSSRHRGVVTAMVGQFRSSGAKTLHLMLPAGSHNENAARHVGADMVRHMKFLGLTENQIKIERYHASNHGDAATIRLVYGTARAQVASECGQWGDDLGDTRENVNYGNYGCATQNNLAEMIANPEDLLGPRGVSEIDASRRDNVISDWRADGT